MSHRTPSRLTLAANFNDLTQLRLKNIFLVPVILFACNQDNPTAVPDSNTHHLPIKFDSTSWTYSAELTTDHINRRLFFLTYPIDSATGNYSELRYQTTSMLYEPKFNYPDSKLTEEIPYMKLLWDSLSKKVKTNLLVATIGFPAKYKDVLNDYILMIQSSKEYDRLIKHFPKADYPYSIIEDLLVRSDLYKPFDSLCNLYGYRIDKYFTEKHFFLDKDFLKKNNLDTTLKIPMPMGFGIRLKLNKSAANNVLPKAGLTE